MLFVAHWHLHETRPGSNVAKTLPMKILFHDPTDSSPASMSFAIRLRIGHNATVGLIPWMMTLHVQLSTLTQIIIGYTG